jgi:hypothetical protein
MLRGDYWTSNSSHRNYRLKTNDLLCRKESNLRDQILGKRESTSPELQGAFYDLWPSAVCGEYLAYGLEDDFAMHPDNVRVDHHMCHVLNHLDWYETGLPDSLSVFEGEALNESWGESVHEEAAILTTAVEAYERERQWELMSEPGSSTDDDD